MKATLDFPASFPSEWTGRSLAFHPKTACLMALILGGAASMAVAEPMASPFTNAIPQSVFRDTEMRDPFSPVGYKKPVLTKEGGAEEARPAVEFKLVITGISMMGDQTVATLQNGQIIEPGEIYQFTDKDGKTSVPYKVLRILEDRVVALFEEKEYEFKLKGSSLDDFIEKEEKP